MKSMALFLIGVFLFTGCMGGQQMTGISQRGIEVEKGFWGFSLKATGEYLASVKKLVGKYNAETKEFEIEIEGLEADQRLVDISKIDVSFVQAMAPMMQAQFKMWETMNGQFHTMLTNVAESVAPVIGMFAAGRAVPQESGGCSLSLPQSADEINQLIAESRAVYDMLRRVTTQPVGVQ